MEKKEKVEKSDVARRAYPSQVSATAAREEEMLAFWNEHDIFNKSVEKDAPNGDFVFYDGPPFATGLPHYGHLLAGTIKDAVPRFWTMNGYRVRRRWGWDCHGLPLENIIEKRLGLATKRDIEEYGVKKFNEAARDAVLEYADDWRRIVPRMGRFVDMEHDYKTMEPTYTESVWWVFSELNKKGLVYEGFKSMHLCPRCGTTLSNFEVNQGYKDIKDIAVTVKLPLVDEPDTSLLVWTTTPWTLPGNMAAAVHEDIEYLKVRKRQTFNDDLKQYPSIENIIVAKERWNDIKEGMDSPMFEFEILETFKGKELVGKSYTPPFDFWQKQEFEGKENSWKIYHADYVEIGEEGTGAVHLAPAYGEEDMELAKREGIPIVHHVDEGGHFMDFVEGFNGALVKPKDNDEAEVSHLDTDIEIVKALKESGRLFKKENITHSYPHCWRCDTPLLNYATTSWFVEVTDIKDELVAENKKVHWVPEHVGRARFGKWLEGARDWAVSRQRYWGAPLPIWRNPETKEYKVFGSLKDLQEYVPKSGNTYYTLRHGESEKNVLSIVTGKTDAYPLTDKGISDVKEAAKELGDAVDVIISSPLLRAKQTADVVAETLGMSAGDVIVDDRLRECEYGAFEGKSLEEYRKSFPREQRFAKKPEGGESWLDIQKRAGEFLFDVEKKYKDKKVLIVSHGDPLLLLHSVAARLNHHGVLEAHDQAYPKKGVIEKVEFIPFPHNDNYELDYHRPYIDEIELYDGEVKLERVPDVFDCWFESGSMPYAQHHYPFEHKKEFEKELFPANFIAESIDQTRGWFYSLIVLGTALFGKSPYENVITNGLVLAEDGRKMSKSLQNYPDPVELVDRQGADTMRYYLLSSSIIRGEDLNFSEKEVAELQRKNLGRLHNVLAMYELYADGEKAVDDSKNVLDRWIVARLNQLVAETTEGFKNYELDKATRPVTDFIDGLSVWYIRRSRDRFKGGDEKDRVVALGTLRHVLKTLSLVIAPSMPFYAEYLWQQVKEDGDAESVHLAAWPEGGEIDQKVLLAMETTREEISKALEVRVKAGIKVRQPLAAVRMNVSLGDEYEELIKDEINVKEVVIVPEVQIIELDTNITPELQAEGDARELMRAIQDMRKKAGLEPHDRIALVVQTSDAGEEVIKTHEEMIKATVGADDITFGDAKGEEVVAGEHSFTIELITKG